MSTAKLIESHRYEADRDHFFESFNDFMSVHGKAINDNHSDNAVSSSKVALAYNSDQAMILAAVLPKRDKLSLENRMTIVDALGRSIYETDPNSSPRHKIRSSLKFLMELSFRASVLSPTGQIDLSIPDSNTKFELDEETYARSREILLWRTGHIPKRSLIKLAIENTLRTTSLDIDRYLHIQTDETEHAKMIDTSSVAGAPAYSPALTIPESNLLSSAIGTIFGEIAASGHIRDMHGLNRFEHKNES